MQDLYEDWSAIYRNRIPAYFTLPLARSSQPPSCASLTAFLLFLFLLLVPFSSHSFSLLFAAFIQPFSSLRRFLSLFLYCVSSSLLVRFFRVQIVQIVQLFKLLFQFLIHRCFNYYIICVLICVTSNILVVRVRLIQILTIISISYITDIINHRRHNLEAYLFSEYINIILKNNVSPSLSLSLNSFLS